MAQGVPLPLCAGTGGELPAALLDSPGSALGVLPHAAAKALAGITLREPTGDPRRGADPGCRQLARFLIIQPALEHNAKGGREAHNRAKDLPVGHTRGDATVRPTAARAPRRLDRTSPKAIGIQSGGEMSRFREPAHSAFPPATDRRSNHRHVDHEELGPQLRGFRGRDRDVGPPRCGDPAVLIGGSLTPPVAAPAHPLPVHGLFYSSRWSACVPAVLHGDAGAPLTPYLESTTCHRKEVVNGLVPQPPADSCPERLIAAHPRTTSTDGLPRTTTTISNRRRLRS